MKKILTSFLLLFIFCGCSCKNDLISYDGGVYLTLPDELLPYLIDNTTIPKKKFAYNGKLNVASFSTKAKYILAGNDHYQQSDAFLLHLNEFGTNFINTSALEQKNDAYTARFGGIQLPIDEPNQYAIEYIRVAWDEQGTRYSYQFRTFTSGGRDYYTYCYTTNMTMVLEIPLMVINKDNATTNQLALIPLPFDTLYEVGNNLEIDSMIKKSTYLKDDYYTFIYPNHLKHYSLVEKEQAVKDWYIAFCNGEEIDNQFIIEYLNHKFIVKWGYKKISKTDKIEQDAFKLIFYE